MKRAYQYRLYPNREQRVALDQLVDAGRHLYNAALEHRLRIWKRFRASVTYLDQARDLRVLRNEIAELGMLNFSACQQVLRRLDKNYRAFLRGQRGRPRFKSTERFRSLEFRLGDGMGLRDGRLYIQNVGLIKVKWHRNIPQEAIIKDVVLTRRDDKWFVTFRLKLPEPTPEPNTKPPVGLDLGVENLIATSKGELIKAPRFYRQAEDRLKQLQRAYSQSGSRRKRKKLAKLHAKVARQRKDFLHKLSRQLVDMYGLIAVEKLNTKGLGESHRHGLNKSIRDAGWGQFLHMLDYKAEIAGVQVVRVPPQYTSQICSNCGAHVPKLLPERQHKCPSCGIVLDRDVNAARNILNRALGWDTAVGLELRPEKHPVLTG